MNRFPQPAQSQVLVVVDWDTLAEAAFAATSRAAAPKISWLGFETSDVREAEVEFRPGSDEV